MRLFGGEVPFYQMINRAPDDGGGAGDDGGADDNTLDAGTDDGGPAPDDAGEPDAGEAGGEPDKPLTVREQLKRSIAEAQEADEKAAKGKTKKGDRLGGRKEKEAAAAPAQQAPQDGGKPQAIPAPESLPKEAREAWENTPEVMQAAFVKREQDMARGVEELKNKYSAIDQALAPHVDALRSMNAQPGEAIDRLFLWFKALTKNPVQSIPALIQSCGYDVGKVMAAMGAQAQQPQGQAGQQAAQQGQPGGQVAPEIPEPIKNYISQLEQQLAGVTQYLGNLGQKVDTYGQTIEAQNDARAAENLSIWSRDKEYFGEVRGMMAELIQKGMVPIKDGVIDNEALDRAYEHAMYLNPDVRSKVLAKQQQANQQVQQQQHVAATTAQQQQVARARKAASSVPANKAPGSPVANSGTPKGKGMSVRDSLRDAVKQLQDQ